MPHPVDASRHVCLEMLPGASRSVMRAEAKPCAPSRRAHGTQTARAASSARREGTSPSGRSPGQQHTTHVRPTACSQRHNASELGVALQQPNIWPRTPAHAEWHGYHRQSHLCCINSADRALTSSESKYLLTTLPAVMAPSRRIPGPPGDLYACEAHTTRMCRQA